ncbi:Ig-like domain-containing protein, partial [Microcoleus sp. A2-D3]
MSSPNNGKVVFNSDGSFSYTPNPGFAGFDNFSYSVSDGTSPSPPIPVNLNVTNFSPAGQPDSYSIPHDKVFNLPARGVLANDSDSDGDTLTAKLVSSPNNGKVVFNSDGSFSYTPNPGFAGFDNFSYSVSDGASPSPPIPVNLNVTNQSVVGQSDSYSIPHDKVFNLPAPGVLANDDNLEGDTLTAKLVSVPNNGKLNFNADGSFSYTPNPGFAGFDNFSYSVSDGASPSPPISVNLNVTNQPPGPQPDNYRIPHDKVFNLLTRGVLANDDNYDGDPQTAKLLSVPSNGKLNFKADGSFSYTPNPGFAGFDNFSYSVSDGASPSPPISVDLNVTNFPPEPQPDNYSIPQDKVFNLPARGVLANDSDPDGDALTAKLVSLPNQGKVVFNSDGSFSYTPNPGFAGFDNFSYSVSDGVLASPPISVDLNVTKFLINQPPQANSDRYTTPHDKTLNIPIPGLLANDIDPDGDPLTAKLESGPSNGKLNFKADGSFSYTPNPGFAGLDNFSYSITDGAFPPFLGVPVNINVTNQPPQANSDSYNTPHDKTLNIPIPGLLVNDIDPDGDTLTAKLESGPSNGKLNFNADGSFSYTPNPGFAGFDNFSYSITDGAFPPFLGVPVKIIVTNQPPQANRDSYNTPHDKTLNVLIPGVLVNDIDPDGDPLTAKLESGPSNGKVIFNADGSFSYTPNPGFAGFDNFTYSISDGAFPPFFTTVPVNLNVTNQPPQANSDSYNTPHDKTLNVLIPGVLANDIDPDGDTL